MARKKTSVRVKRTTFYALHSGGTIAWLFSKKSKINDRIPIVAIDRRDLADLESRMRLAELHERELRALTRDYESRLQAAEAECKRLRKIADAANEHVRIGCKGLSRAKLAAELSRLTPRSPRK